MDNYNNHNLVTFSNSLLKHYGVTPFHQSEEKIDEILKGHQKVAVILFDGMGQNIIRKHLKDKSFIRQNYLCTINSTFPPTTTAATTAFLTGKYPIETGWLSWTQYFEEYQRNIILFKNVDYNNDEELAPKGIANKTLPIKTILELIKENNPGIQTFDIKRFPIDPQGPKTLKDFEKVINQTLKDPQKCLAYFYFDSPDYEMHNYGIDSLRVHFLVNKINRMVKRVCKNNKDTLFITFADHGHINVKYFDICEHQDLYGLLSRPLSFEKRTPAFFIKEGRNKEFETLFNKYYGEYFVLMDKKSAINQEIFGEGKPTREVEKFIGDYIAISTSEYCLYASKEMRSFIPFKGHHAGGTKEERLIDVSAYNV